MRDLHIDQLKGFLIICVLWGHIGVLTTAIPTANLSWWRPFQDFISTFLPVNYFHMAMFFALSILFVKPITTGFIKKRALLLLVPYVFWYVWPAKDALLTDPFPIARTLAYGSWHHIASPLWFLPACFTLSIYFSVYRKYAKTWWAILFWVAWLAVFLLADPIAARYHNSIPFGIDLALYLFPLCVVIDTIYQQRHRLTNLRPWYALLLLPVYLGSIQVIDWIEPVKTYSAFTARIDLAQFSVPFTFLGFIALAGLMSSIMIFFLLVPPLRWLATVGKYSLPIYLMHLIAFGKLILLYNQISWWDNPLYFFVASCAAFPIVLGCCMLYSKLLTKLSPYAKYIGMI
ncbi:MAG: hypothetical protein ACD_41C00092G0004 [uncultured bacterium]|nr:MAG: hypothetical protein ACD_41C00092G0004 [uncultured bacterium]HBY73419.1 hypothetical protein [Candidatus Kerfeldbacteria bacterium]